MLLLKWMKIEKLFKIFLLPMKNYIFRTQAF